MFASRANQENVIHEQQTAAAAKPLNQGVRGLAPKTPGNKAPKTPFKVSLNDENVTLGGGKTGGKGKQSLFGEGKTGKVESSTFVTPAGPRNRAPLGNKTTNAKATAFQTPAPPTQEKPSAKQTSPRMRRAKIKVHEAETVIADNEEDEPEIEYMAPRGEPLPDHPDDCWPADRTYPQFEGKNLSRGWWSEFAPEKDDDDDEFSDLEEKIKKIEELNKKKKQAQAKKTTVVKQSPMQKTSRDPLTAKPAQGLSSKSAASALSSSAKTHLGKPTKPAGSTALASKKASASTVAPGNARHTAAKVVSNSTLGYSKGRAVSSTSSRKPLVTTKSKSQSNENVSSFTSATKGGPMKTLDELFNFDDLDLGDEPVKVPTGSDDEDELEHFQLDPVEL